MQACRHAIVNCWLCSDERTPCPTCKGFVRATDWRRRDKVCQCLPLAIVDSDGDYAGLIARFVPPNEQFERDPVDPDLKNRQFSTYLSDTGQTDLGSDLDFDSAPAIWDTPDRFGELLFYCDEPYITPVAPEGTDDIYLRDGYPWNELVSEGVRLEAHNAGIDLNEPKVPDELELDEPVDWLPVGSCRTPTRHAPRRPDAGREAIRAWRKRYRHADAVPLTRFL